MLVSRRLGCFSNTLQVLVNRRRHQHLWVFLRAPFEAADFAWPSAVWDALSKACTPVLPACCVLLLHRCVAV